MKPGITPVCMALCVAQIKRASRITHSVERVGVLLGRPPGSAQRFRGEGAVEHRRPEVEMPIISSRVGPRAWDRWQERLAEMTGGKTPLPNRGTEALSAVVSLSGAGSTCDVYRTRAFVANVNTLDGVVTIHAHSDRIRVSFRASPTCAYER